MAWEHCNLNRWQANIISAYWTDETGEQHTTLLPAAKSNGLVLHVDPYNNDQLHYKLEKSADASNLTKIIVVGTINQKIVYRNSLMLENNMAEANIARHGFSMRDYSTDGV